MSERLQTTYDDSYAFAIDRLQLDESHSLTCLSIESKESFLPYLPQDWEGRMADEVASADLVIPEYFPPELESTTYRGALGAIAAKYAGDHLTVYNTLASQAGAADRQVAVMDMANKPLFMAYSAALPSYMVHLSSVLRDKGVATRNPDTFERVLPTVTDARRMVTAAGIQQEADRWPDGGNFLYVAAPAHVTRVVQNLTRPRTRLDSARYAAYQRATPGLDKAVRTYQHEPGDGWQLVGVDPIR